MMRKALGLAVAALAAVLLAGCGGGSPTTPRATVATCAKAYPAWFAASAAAGKATATPAACKGLTEAQVTEISVKYLEGQ